MKINKIIVSLVLALTCTGMYAQSLDYNQALNKVLEGNLRLKVENSRTDAQMLENRTGMNLPNPEVEFSYQGNRYGVDKKTLDVTQEFDFATLSGAKKGLAVARDSRAKENISIVRSNVESEADQLMTEIVYLRKMKEMLNLQLSQDKKVFEAVESMYANGAVNIVELNAAKMEYRLTENAYKLNGIELANSMSQLERIANGKVNWTDAKYMEYELPADFDAWSRTASNPEIDAADADARVAQQEITIQKREQLPNFSIGYRSEMTGREDSFYGGSIGLEIPLWQNRGKMKAAKAAKLAAELEHEALREEFIISQRNIYSKALQLKKTSEEITRLSDECDIADKLQKMLNLGEISVTDYINQLKPILEMKQKKLECERDYQLELARFRACNL